MFLNNLLCVHNTFWLHHPLPPNHSLVTKSPPHFHIHLLLLCDLTWFKQCHLCVNGCGALYRKSLLISLWLVHYLQKSHQLRMPLLQFEILLIVFKSSNNVCAISGLSYVCDHIIQKKGPFQPFLVSSHLFFFLFICFGQYLQSFIDQRISFASYLISY